MPVVAQLLRALPHRLRDAGHAFGCAIFLRAELRGRAIAQPVHQSWTLIVLNSWFTHDHLWIVKVAQCEKRWKVRAIE
jgi:hypothetical protein